MKLAHKYTVENKHYLKFSKILLQWWKLSSKINEMILSQYAYTDMNKSGNIQQQHKWKTIMISSIIWINEWLTSLDKVTLSPYVSQSNYIIELYELIH